MTIKKNIIKDKSYQFALKIIRLYRNMMVQKEYILSKQLIRSGTSIGANYRGSNRSPKRKRFSF